jgi:hypothetical protein
MTTQDLFDLEDFDEFIADIEDKWLQYTPIEERIKIFFGSTQNSLELFNKWKNDEELFAEEKAKAFPNPYRFE